MKAKLEALLDYAMAIANFAIWLVIIVVVLAFIGMGIANMFAFMLGVPPVFDPLNY